MLLNVDGFEIEIRGDAFVCIDDGVRTHFCEWKCLDSKLQNTFIDIKNKVLVILEDFVTSDNKLVFDNVADQIDNVK